MTPEQREITRQEQAILDHLAVPNLADLMAYVESQVPLYDDILLHMVSAHANAAALGATVEDSHEQHRHEHYGPGGIRNHDFDSRHWNLGSLMVVLLEGLEPDDDTPESHLAALREEMRRPDWVAVMGPGEHAHDFSDDFDSDFIGWTACSEGRYCGTYPRWYDARFVRSPDGEPKEITAYRMTTREDDIARCLLSARGAFALVDQARANNFLYGSGERAAQAIDAAGVRLDDAMALLHPVLYPDMPHTPDPTTPPVHLT